MLKIFTVWQGKAEILCHRGHVAICTMYSTALRSFFEAVGLNSFDAAACWEALSALAHAYSGNNLEAEVAVVYQELERFAASPDFDPANKLAADPHVLAFDTAAGNQRRVVGCRREQVLLNDDPYAYDVVADTQRLWLDTKALENCPKLLRQLTRSDSCPVQRLSAAERVFNVSEHADGERRGPM